MRQSLRTGLGFGITSGIITTLGLIVGLSSATHSKLAVIGGIIVIAIADSLSDAMGIHISEESRNTKTKDVWESTGFTFLFKFLFAISFIVPVLFFQEITTAILASIIWGSILLTGFSYYIAKIRKDNPFHQITEHLLLAAVVITATHFIGTWINLTFI